MKRAFITGVTGQDGSFLAEFLLEKNYEVYGMRRHVSTSNIQNIEYLRNNLFFSHFHVVHGDLADSSNLLRIIEQIKPDEIYNLGAQSGVAESFVIPEETANITGLGALRILDALHHLALPAKFYQASSSEMFGKTTNMPQHEDTIFDPQSPYAIAKLMAFYVTRLYRKSFGIFASNGILFNHESERRGPTFVTRKITRGLARIICGLQQTVQLGNLNAVRDWGHARDYVEAIWRILQHHEPDDFVIATGQSHTIREFVEETAKHLNREILWEGEGINEKGIDRKTGKIIIEVSPVYFRPSDVDFLQGNAAKARRLLGWEPKTTFNELVKRMVEHDLEVARKEL